MKLPEPFLGRLLLEIIKENADDFIKEQLKEKVSEDFLNKIELVRGDMVTDPHSGQQRFQRAGQRTPISKGRIIKKAPDAFGQAFKDRYGDVGYTPDLGDIVLFIPNESYRVDPADNYHLIADTDICGYMAVEEPIKEQPVEVKV